MGKTSNESKQKWVAENRKQIKVLAPAVVADEFKKACASSGQSINKTFIKYMEIFVQKKPPKTLPPLHITTRPQRRKSLQILLVHLRELRDAECNYYESIPDNLQNGDMYEKSVDCVDVLDEAIELLEDAFQ